MTTRALGGLGRATGRLWGKKKGGGPPKSGGTATGAAAPSRAAEKGPADTATDSALPPDHEPDSSD